MRYAFLLLSAAFIMVPNAAAAEPDTAVEPGLIGADHRLYEVDVMLDELTAGVLKSPGTVAHERASEAFVAAEMNDTVAMNRALAEVEEQANRTNGLESGDGLRNAERVLLDLRDRVPEQATFRIDTALESVMRAKDREPDRFGPDTHSPDQLDAVPQQ